ncbi:MAG: hypothetical protein A2731_02850 [Candidatus Buchananbacteria bacterium RIFCSPHIGHO2_01_FULL_39_8]|uniref:Cell division protein FtsX n=1 Tax=Candidatus Buchananbacteria bacterium RIFCSPHIGHO2_01_FULL_39_8 TaxID=1797533 RepID=A0A1G1XVK6_9BACT|nr:hypothetical protein [uncultured bacterium]OGY44109.1 MAG: hypothetical protein A2731_02850 [Candidatus Buchananbacteria bacterium RIFCSPHIGHO2_01_FULL_39_8]HLC89821.1 permease-like cell division protein FtsX [Patescibacteria group bacterium]
MSLNSIYQIIIFAWQSFWRNIWLSIVTITIITLAVLSINFLIVLNIITDTATNLVKEKIDFSIYFRQDATENQVLEVQTYLSSLAQVKEIKYTSQQEALQKFREKHQQDSPIIESLEELDQNPLGATLVVTAKEIEDYPEIIEVLNNSKYNDLILDKNFDDHKVYINKIRKISENINRIGLLASGIFIFIALLIVINTVRVAIYTHRREIGIMKLVGATNWFIRSPFLLESVLYSIIACALAIGIIYPLLNFIQPYLNNFFLTDDFNILEYFNKNFWQIFGLEVLIIILLNIFSSSIAIRRYLRV